MLFFLKIYIFNPGHQKYLVDYLFYYMLGYTQAAQVPANSFAVITENSDISFTMHYNTWKVYFFLVFLKMNIEILLITYSEMENTEH